MTTLKTQQDSGLILFWCILMACCLVLGCWVYNYDGRLCEAIRRAENSTVYPYGVKTKYATTSPKQACINTIRNVRSEWVKSGRKGRFLRFLGAKYCPMSDVGCHNWEKNVAYWLKRGLK